MLSDVCLICTSGLSREQRPRKTKIGTEVAHVTRDSYTTFEVKGQGHQAAGNILAMGTYCYVAICTLHVRSAQRQGASAPTEAGKGRGHIVAAARLQLDTFRFLFVFAYICFTICDCML